PEARRTSCVEARGAASNLCPGGPSSNCSPLLRACVPPSSPGPQWPELLHPPPHPPAPGPAWTPPLPERPLPLATFLPLLLDEKSRHWGRLPSRPCGAHDEEGRIPSVYRSLQRTSCVLPVGARLGTLPGPRVPGWRAARGAAYLPTARRVQDLLRSPPPR